MEQNEHLAKVSTKGLIEMAEAINSGQPAQCELNNELRLKIFPSNSNILTAYIGLGCLLSYELAQRLKAYSNYY